MNPPVDWHKQAREITTDPDFALDIALRFESHMVTEVDPRDRIACRAKRDFWLAYAAKLETK